MLFYIKNGLWPWGLFIYFFILLEKWWLEALGAIHHLWIRAAGASSSCPSRMEAAFNKTVIQSEQIQSFLFFSPRWKTKIKQLHVNQTSPFSVSFAVNTTDFDWLIRSIVKNNHVKSFLKNYIFISMLFWYFYLLRYISPLTILALGLFVSIKLCSMGYMRSNTKRSAAGFSVFYWQFFFLNIPITSGGIFFN